MTRTPRRLTALAIATALTAASLAGCGVSGSEAPAAAPTPGVTDDTITLGILSDLSGPFAGMGTSITQGQQLHAEQLNAAGGVCGRKVKLVIKDHGYQVDRALARYNELRAQVLGLEQLFGSPTTAALITNIDSDRIMTVPGSWDSSLLKNPYLAVMGSTYDVETINAVGFLMQRGLQSGDHLGHVLIDNEYGRNALLGSTYAADKLRLSLTSAKVSATQTDFSGTIADLRAARARAVVATISPKQLFALVTAMRAAGLDIPVVANTPAFSPSLVKGQGAKILTGNLFIAGSAAPAASIDPAVQAFAKAYRKRFPDSAPDAGATFGYGAATAYTQLLRAACARGTLTRDALATAFRTSTSVETGSMLGKLDFSQPGGPSSRSTAISVVDASVDGALQPVQGLSASQLAEGYHPPTQVITS